MRSTIDYTTEGARMPLGGHDHTAPGRDAATRSCVLPIGVSTGRENRAGTVVLTARGVPGCLPTLVRGSRVVTIHNAADSYGPAQRDAKVDRDHQALADLGFIPRGLDLRETVAAGRVAGARSAALLETADALWVGGGNTFHLLALLRRSGLAQHLPHLVEAGLVYVGQSAGAVAAAPHIRGAETVDRVPRSSRARTSRSEPGDGRKYEGLDLVSFFAWAHWNPQRRDRHDTPSGVDPATTVPIIGLSDNEHFVVSGPHLDLHAHADCIGDTATPQHPTLF